MFSGGFRSVNVESSESTPRLLRVIAGFFLGESENLFTAFFPDPTRALSYTNAFGVLVLMIVLIVKPTGLFGRRHVRME